MNTLRLFFAIFKLLKFSEPYHLNLGIFLHKCVGEWNTYQCISAVHLTIGPNFSFKASCWHRTHHQECGGNRPPDRK